MINTGMASDEFETLRRESDWVAVQLERLQRVVLHVSQIERGRSADRQTAGQSLG